MAKSRKNIFHPDNTCIFYMKVYIQPYLICLVLIGLGRNRKFKTGAYQSHFTLQSWRERGEEGKMGQYFARTYIMHQNWKQIWRSSSTKESTFDIKNETDVLPMFKETVRYDNILSIIDFNFAIMRSWRQHCIYMASYTNYCMRPMCPL